MSITQSKPTYHRLSAGARSEISWAGLPIAEYIRAWWPDGRWGGDRCGCPDDRCRGHHHDVDEACGCLPALLREWVTAGTLSGCETATASPQANRAVVLQRDPAPAPREVRAPGRQGYCPWVHLGHLPEVTLAWHDGGDLGFTDFESLTVSLRRGQTEAQLRSTLAHELAHVERGPGYGPTDSARYRIEEKLVDATAMLRLIPAGVLEDLPELVEEHGQEAAMAFLLIDKYHLKLALKLATEARPR
jgi:hypothetical protein